MGGGGEEFNLIAKQPNSILSKLKVILIRGIKDF